MLEGLKERDRIKIYFNDMLQNRLQIKFMKKIQLF